MITFLLLCLAVAMTRPCHKEMGPMPMPGMHRMNEMQGQGFMPRAEVQNHTRGLKRAPHAKDMGKHPDLHERHSAPEQKQK